MLGEGSREEERKDDAERGLLQKSSLKVDERKLLAEE